MHQVSLKVKKREKKGKEGCKKFRAEGMVPGIVYGKNFENVMVLVDAIEFRKTLTTSAGTRVIINLEVEGQKKEVYTTMVTQIQKGTYQKQYIHVDFQKISLDEIVHTEVPVKLMGEAKGVKAGGVMDHLLWTIPVEGLPLDIPESIPADVRHMEEEDHLLVKDLILPDNVKVLIDGEETVAVVHPPRVISEEEITGKAAVAAEAPAEAEAVPA